MLIGTDLGGSQGDRCTETGGTEKTNLCFQEENVKNFSNFTFDEKLEAPRANVSTSSLGINTQREIRLVRQVHFCQFQYTFTFSERRISRQQQHSRG